MAHGPLIRGFEVVIGIETHAQLSTQSKIFSGSSTRFGAAPNTQASAVDLALPGTLPVMNRGAVERAIRFGLAVGATVAPLSIFARKNYFYPDLPKGYQISQYETPVVQGGAVEFLVGDVAHRVNLTRAHLEEDAGKSLHEDYQGQTGIDLNRAGTPLLEIVTEPDMRSSAEAVAYAKKLHSLVVWYELCDGNMQEGSFRCDANVSVRRPGATYGTRREIKNLNSFKFMQQAIDFEVQWQIDLIEDGGAVQQATVLFDPDSGETRAMRSKEDAHDYRYFPDPDLPPLVIAPEWVERVRADMPESPDAMANRLQLEYGLSPTDCATLTTSRWFADAFVVMSKFVHEANPAGWTASEFSDPAAPWFLEIATANFLIQVVAPQLSRDELTIEAAPLTLQQLARVVVRRLDNSLSAKLAKDLFLAMWQSPQPGVDFADRLIETRGLRQMSDTSELDRILDEVLAANPKSVDEYRAGKDKAFNALVGQAMKASKGKANPTLVNERLKQKLG